MQVTMEPFYLSDELRFSARNVAHAVSAVMVITSTSTRMRQRLSVIT